METKKSVSVFLDEDLNPIKQFSPPANFTLDTTQISDGSHTLTFIAKSSDGVEGIKKVDFIVRNGPEIALNGLKNNDIVSDQVNMSINAYGSENKEKFIVSGSETPRAIPAWLWVIIIFFVSWAIFYAITYWN